MKIREYNPLSNNFTETLLDESQDLCTELPDRNGTIIYINDIVDDSYTSPLTGYPVIQQYVVKLEHGRFKMISTTGQKELDRDLLINHKNIMVCGNTHQKGGV